MATIVKSEQRVKPGSTVVFNGDDRRLETPLRAAKSYDDLAPNFLQDPKTRLFAFEAQRCTVSDKN